MPRTLALATTDHLFFSQRVVDVASVEEFRLMLSGEAEPSYPNAAEDPTVSVP